MADHSVLSGGASGPVRRDELDPKVDVADALAGQSGDSQARRYAHTTRRSGATITPPSGVGTVAVGQAAQRDISTISMPKLPAGAKGSAPRLSPADPRDSAKLTAPRPSAAGPRDSAKLTAPRPSAADPRDSAKLAVPRLLSDDDPHDSTNVTMPKLSTTDARDSARSVLPRPEVDHRRDSERMALPRPAIDDPLDSTKITMPKAAIDNPRESARIALPKPPRPATAPPTDPASPAAANSARAPSDSTALYRKRNTRPTLPALQADGTPRPEAPPEPADDAPSAILVDEISIPEPPGADSPSRLPSVMLDADPGRMALLRVPSLPSLPRTRLFLPIAVVAAMAIAAWLLHSML